ncbi:MAG TPA: LysM peptidoglycan-binding domain-containing protein, partial [Crenotrichaceae bacterium]|nr:LysM peptidoglycan-binding domain-containing protein [Crenotrichaceae bacterium]
MSRLVCFFLFLFLVMPSAQASFSPRYYQLDCGQYFSCPQALQRRIHFWIDIFGRYSTDTAVFHDRDEPEIVYSVIENPGACGGRSTPKAIERERSRIKKQLRSIANKKRHHQQFTKTEKQLALVFKNKSPAYIRKASGKIRCQSGNSTRFRKAVQRFGAHRQLVAAALNEFGLPDGIQYLPFVESAYAPDNYSRVGAAGLWQLMPSTASHLGLLVNPVIDERMDPEISTLGAIKYLQHSFEVLAPAARTIDPGVTEADIYPFVMTSYNFGLSGMLKAMNEVGVDFVAVLENYKNRNFQVAVKNFYASFLAARHVATHADQFFALLPESKPVQTMSVTNQKPRSAKVIARHLGLSIDDLRTHNPALTTEVWKGQHLIPKGFVLHIPKPESVSLGDKIARLNRLPASKPPSKRQHYRVRRGDSACGIAHRFKVSCRQLIRINKLGRKAIVRIGRTLTIPGGSVVLKKPVTAARTRIFGNQQFSTTAIMAAPVKTIRYTPVKYTVVKGDTTCGIAKQHMLSCDKLKRYNNIKHAGKIFVGQTLTIPGKRKTVVSKFAINQQGKTNQIIANNDFFSLPDANASSVQLLAEIHYTSHLHRFLSHIHIPSPEKISGKPIPITLAKNSATVTGKQSTAGVSSNQVKTTQTTSGTAKNVNIADADTNNKTRSKRLNKKPSGTSPSADTIAHSFNSGEDLHVSYKKGKGWIIRVATDETLGHYADWLDIGFSKPILKLNGIKSTRSIRIGKSIKLPIRDNAARQRFEKKRLAYHQQLQEKYFKHYSVTGKKQYHFRSGDNPWTIATAHQIPLWLLKRFNPDIFKSRHDIGNILVL